MTAPVTAAHGMVASSQRLASEVGVELLRAGGSAVDAAIGVNAMLGLIEPHMCGLGGDLFAQVWDPQRRELLGLNASGRAPAGQSLDALTAQLGEADSIPQIGVHAVTTPGAVAGWQALHERFGRLPIARVLAPVADCAEQGVTIGAATAVWWAQTAQAVLDGLGENPAAAEFAAVFLSDGKAPEVGARFCNPALGRTCRRLGQAGLRDFYEGELAAELAQALAGWGTALDAADLAACTAQWVTPISTDYRGYTVSELPPNGQGLTVLQMLNLLERYPLCDTGPQDAEYWHLLIEAKKLAFEDRARFYADPAFTAVPLEALASKDYAAARQAQIGVAAATRPLPGDPSLSRGDTTYLSVADREGMMVSLIQSVYGGFGAGLVSPQLGFALQCRGAGFSLEAGHPNAYAPGKRPFHTIIPAFVLRDGEPLMSFGVMGADMQPQGQVQVLVNQLDFGMNEQAAGDALRLRHDGLNAPNRTAVSDAGVIYYEQGFDPALVTALTARGHTLRPATDPVHHFMGGYQCVSRTDDGWRGASECRFDGCAMGLDD